MQVFLFCLCIAGATLSARAATLSQATLDGHAEACELGSALPGSPLASLSPAERKKFCACEVRAYWDSVPQALLEAVTEEMLEEKTQRPAQKKLLEQMKQRGQASRRLCNTQLGLDVPADQ